MTETELGISKLANGVAFAFWKEDRSGKLLYKFIAKLCGLTRLPAFCIEDKYKPYIVTKEEYEKIKREDYELTIETIYHYKNKACWMIGSNCDKCEAMYMQNRRQWCCFDTVIRFIEYVNKYI